MKILIFILFLSSFMMAGCSPDGDSGEGNISTDLVSSPISASTSGNKGKKIIMSFEDSKYDFGEIIQGEKITHSYSFTNTGDAPLIISSVKASCGCTVPTWDREPIEPGGSGKIKVVFNSEDKHGTQSKDITIVSNAVPNTSVLRLTGEVIIP